MQRCPLPCLSFSPSTTCIHLWERAGCKASESCGPGVVNGQGGPLPILTFQLRRGGARGKTRERKDKSSLYNMVVRNSLWPRPRSGNAPKEVRKEKVLLHWPCGFNVSNQSLLLYWQGFLEEDPTVIKLGTKDRYVLSIFLHAWVHLSCLRLFGERNFFCLFRLLAFCKLLNQPSLRPVQREEDEFFCSPRFEPVFLFFSRSSLFSHCWASENRGKGKGNASWGSSNQVINIHPWEK